MSKSKLRADRFSALIDLKQLLPPEAATMLIDLCRGIDMGQFRGLLDALASNDTVAENDTASSHERATLIRAWFALVPGDRDDELLGELQAFLAGADPSPALEELLAGS